ncbi:MAG TPA: nucleotide exchange factor GrpE [Proteobacteria bacterium]|nr:nucleotide exchange factor GrpE [Pseudomonadota bacterium]
MSTGKKHHGGKKPAQKINPDYKDKAEIQDQKDEMVKISRSELDDLRKKASADSEYHDKMLRTMADMENLRKKLDRDRKDYINYANREMISELLPVLDNFDRALKSVERTEESAPYLQGVEMIYKQLEELLKKQGLEEIKALGEPFNPHLHEAVQTEETDSCSEDTILDVILKGYLFRGNMLRPAAVKVSRNINAK